MSSTAGRPRKYASVDEIAELREEIAALKVESPTTTANLEAEFPAMALLSLVQSEGRMVVGWDDIYAAVEFIGQAHVAYLMSQGKIDEGLALYEVYKDRVAKAEKWSTDRRNKQVGGGFGDGNHTREELEARLRTNPAADNTTRFGRMDIRTVSAGELSPEQIRALAADLPSGGIPE